MAERTVVIVSFFAGLGLGLSACGTVQPLPPPGAASGGQVTYWRGDEEYGIRMRAAAVRQLGDQPGRMQLDQVHLILPLAAGDVHIEAPAAIHEARGDVQVVFTPPVHIHGHLDGAAVVGRAETAHITRTDRSLVLNDLVLLREEGKLTAAAWQLRPGGDGEMIGVDKTVLPEVWRASLPHLAEPDH